jgi:hypothetical protein
LKVRVQESLAILRQKEIRTPIVAANILNNWSVAKEQMARDLGSIYCSEAVTNEEIESFIRHLEFADIVDG